MNNSGHTNTMSRMHLVRQSESNAGIATERTRRSSIPISTSFANSSSYSRISSRTVSTTSSTRSSTPIDALQRRLDEERAELQTEVEKLTMEVERLSYGVAGLVDKVKEKEIKLQDTEEQLSDLACTTRGLQVDIKQRTSDFANLSPDSALWKHISEKWQVQGIPDDHSVVNKDLAERHKEIYTVVIENYVSMHVEIGRLHGMVDQFARERELQEQAAQQQQQQQQRITQLERENQGLTEQSILKQETLDQAEEQAQEQAAQVQAARDQVAEVQAHDDTLTQENNALRVRVEELENQQNGLQQRNNALEMQRRDGVDLIVAILDTLQLRDNFLTGQYNEVLLQNDITREENEQLMQALVNTVNHYENELTLVLCQMTEFNVSTRIPEANDNNPQRPQPRSIPSLRLVKDGSQLHSESSTPDGQWQQTVASRYAQQFSNSLAGLIIRALHFTNT